MAASDASGADSIPEKIRKAFINIPDQATLALVVREHMVTLLRQIRDLEKFNEDLQNENSELRHRVETLENRALSPEEQSPGEQDDVGGAAQPVAGALGNFEGSDLLEIDNSK